MRLFSIVCLAALAVQPAAAQTAQNSCISAKQAASLAGYALPSVITGTAKRCSTTLATDSYLKSNGEALARRYAERKDANWPAAKAAFLTMSKGKDDASKVLSQLPDNSLREMLDVILEGMIAQEIPVGECATIDNFVRLLAPLPPENTAELVSLMVGMASKSKAKPAKPGGMAIC